MQVRGRGRGRGVEISAPSGSFSLSLSQLSVAVSCDPLASRSKMSTGCLHTSGTRVRVWSSVVQAWRNSVAGSL